jgi:ABC-2 type transport system ATP-binding protein
MNDIVLETRGLTKYYGKLLALDHLDLKIPRGCICGFIGRNAAGKTTAIKLMLGLLKPTVGSSTLLGCDSQQLTPAVRQRIGYVTEGHRLPHWMTINDLEGFQRPFFPRQWDDTLFADMIEYLDLPKDKRMKHLSIGQRAQVSLALTLAPNPELLIMDDPTLGLDTAVRHQFLQGMIQIILNAGRTVFFSSHILTDVERVADRIVVIDKGALKAHCTLDHFRKAVKKVRLSFDHALPERLDIDGLLHYRRSDKDLELILVGADDEKIAAWAQNAGAKKFLILKINLEEQFIEFTEPSGRRKLFDWEKI